MVAAHARSKFWVLIGDSNTSSENVEEDILIFVRSTPTGETLDVWSTNCGQGFGDESPQRASVPFRWVNSCGTVSPGDCQHSANEKSRPSRQQRSAEGLAIFHQLIYDEWASGSQVTPLAKDKADEKNCFGVIEWEAVRKAVSRLLPKGGNTEPCPTLSKTDFLRCQKIVAQDKETSTASSSFAWHLGWLRPRPDRALPPNKPRAHENKMQKIQNFQLGGPGKKHIGADDPRHALQENGDLPDLWYIDGW